MDADDLIADAIATRSLLRFRYRGGTRTVEPHLLGVNRAGNPAVLAWFLAGASASGGGAGWREYLLSEMDGVEVLEEGFDAPRPGYNPSGGKNFASVRAAV